jgi:GT2 family glycosyltransferase
MSIGLGIVTYKRPEYLRQVLKGVTKHLTGEISSLYVHHDGSGYPDTRKVVGVQTCTTFSAVNEGVAKAKNRLLRAMLRDKHDWLFIGEDDIVPLSPLAITGYIEACEKSTLHHLSFHAHGPLNTPDLGVPWQTSDDRDWGVTIWPHSVGAWCVYSRECLLKCGLMDETFHNSWEHVEHTLRLGYNGFTTIGKPGDGRYADAKGSENWLAEIPESIGNSSIPFGISRVAHQIAGQAHWKQHHKETYHLVFAE